LLIGRNQVMGLVFWPVAKTQTLMEAMVVKSSAVTRLFQATHARHTQCIGTATNVQVHIRRISFRNDALSFNLLLYQTSPKFLQARFSRLSILLHVPIPFHGREVLSTANGRLLLLGCFSDSSSGDDDKAMSNDYGDPQSPIAAALEKVLKSPLTSSVVIATSFSLSSGIGQTQD
jgi:hypothetical protein